MSAEVQALTAEVEALRRELDARRAETAAVERQLERYASDLRDTFRRERERARQLQESYVSTVRALANAVEARDAYTGHHAERVAAYASRIATATGADLADHHEIEFGFLLHDIGKVAVPDAILYKPEPLSDQERMLMERHPVIGVEILRHIDFLGAAKEVVRSHHERYDGGGYPDGLEGDAIPFAARVFAVADTFDALTTLRPYRPASSVEVARDIITTGSGTQFDPSVVDAFMTISEAELDRIRGEAPR